MRIQRSKAPTMLAMLAIFMIGWAADALAHEGHDHGAPPPPVSKTIAPRADTASDEFEVVVVARGEILVVHLDTFRTNEPIEGAAIQIDAPAGSLSPLPVSGEPGTYVVAAPFLARAGKYDLAITIQARDTVDILATSLTIPEASQVPGEATRPATWFVDAAVAEEVKRRIVETSTSTWGLAVIGFVLGVLLTRLFWPGRARTAAAGAVLLTLASIMQVPREANAESPPDLKNAGRDLAQRFPDGALFVPKSTQRILSIRTAFAEEEDHRRTVELPGRVVPDPNASGLVQASVGGRLAPPPGGFKALGTPVAAGDVLAFVRPPISSADATTQAQQARELDQQISIVTRRLQRLRAIENVVARSQLEDAELELKGLQGRRANLDRAKSEPEPLVAPVAGVIASSNAVAGQMAESNAVIFQIVDPARLWVEALSFVPLTFRGTAKAQLADGPVFDLEHVGTGIADRNQAVPSHFSISGEARGVRVGQLVNVLAAVAEVRRGIAVPRAAVLRGANGQALVYEHTNAERFVPREVRVEPLDGNSVLIVAGVEPRRRVVTQGAELLNQIR